MSAGKNLRHAEVTFILESTTTFRVTVPANTRPGDTFQVYAAGRIVRVRCPPQGRSGEPFQFQVPADPSSWDDNSGPGLRPINDLPPDSHNVRRIDDDHGGPPAYIATAPRLRSSGSARRRRFSVRIRGRKLMVNAPDTVRIVPPEKEEVIRLLLRVPLRVKPGQLFEFVEEGVRAWAICPANAEPGQRIPFMFPPARAGGSKFDDNIDSAVSMAERLKELLQSKVSFDATEVLDIVSKDPALCADKYSWEHRILGPTYSFLLWRICTFQPPLNLVQVVYEAYPQAIQFVLGPQAIQEASGPRGWSPLHAACITRASFDVIHFLISKQPKNIKAKDSVGSLPLHLACSGGAGNFLHLLSHSRAGPSPDAVIRQLVSLYPYGLQVTSDQGLLPLHLACDCPCSTEAIDFLVSQYQDGLKVPAPNGQLPLHLACGSEGATVQAIRVLVSWDRGSTLKAKDRRGRLPLHVACQNPRLSVDVIRYLASEYPDGLKEKTRDGKIPLEDACECHFGYHHALPVAPETICFLASSYPDCLVKFAQNDTLGNWRVAKEYSGAFVLSENPGAKNPGAMSLSVGERAFGLSGKDSSMLAVLYDDGSDAEITGIRDLLQKQDNDVGCVAVIGGGVLCGQTIRLIVKALQVNDALWYLGLSNNSIGDAGAELLAMVLASNKTLRKLDIRSCGIGTAGLLSLLRALRGNKVLTSMDLSHNAGIFNAAGGRAIATHLSVEGGTGLETLYLFRDKDDFCPDVVGFFTELAQLLRWHPKKYRTVVLGRLLLGMVQAMYYYQGSLHENILALKGSVRVSLLHLALKQACNISQNNAEPVFFYVKDMSEHHLLS